MISLFDRTDISKQFVKTYSNDSWKRVQEYRRVLEYTAENPNQGSAAVASALDLKRSRIRTWVDGNGMPDPVKGIHRCEEHGWFDLEWMRPPFTGLNVLVAWIFSGGSINNVFVPSLVVKESTEGVLDSAFERAGVDYRIKRADDPDRGTEAVPQSDASPLGRLLVALGAPQGEKNNAADLTLPDYLSTAPRSIRLDFARTYVLNRGVDNPERPNLPLQISEQRSASYRRELLSLFRDPVDDSDMIRGEPDSPVIYLTQDAVEQLHKEPSFGKTSS